MYDDRVRAKNAVLSVLNKISKQNYADDMYSDDSNYEVKSSPIHGKGIFATQDIKEGTELGVVSEKTKDTGDVDKDNTRTNFGRYMNHADSKGKEADYNEVDCEPNVTIKRD